MLFKEILKVLNVLSNHGSPLGKFKQLSVSRIDFVLELLVNERRLASLLRVEQHPSEEPKQSPVEGLNQ